MLLAASMGLPLTILCRITRSNMFKQVQTQYFHHTYPTCGFFTLSPTRLCKMTSSSRTPLVPRVPGLGPHLGPQSTWHLRSWDYHGREAGYESCFAMPVPQRAGEASSQGYAWQNEPTAGCSVVCLVWRCCSCRCSLMQWSSSCI